jgi:threonine dehydratase
MGQDPLEPAQNEDPGLAEVREAVARIAGRVRRTPTVPAAPARTPLPGRAFLKLECLQVTGSFKARGAVNKALSLPAEATARGLVTASGGNHGLGVAYAGTLTPGPPARIYLPGNTPPSKAEKLRAWGAEVVMAGDVWDDANEAALEAAARDGLAYVHPFADPLVVAGQGTAALEVLEQVPDVETILVAIGGGGLIAGVAMAAQAVRPQVRVVGVEPVGAPTLHASLAAGELVTLPGIATRANTLAPRRSAAINLRMIERHVERVVLVEDDAMRAAARWLWFEHGLGAELSGAAAVAALLSGAYVPRPDERVVAFVCGAGNDGVA